MMISECSFVNDVRLKKAKELQVSQWHTVNFAQIILRFLSNQRYRIFHCSPFGNELIFYHFYRRQA